MREIPEELRAEFDALRETRQRFERLLTTLPGMAYRCRVDPDWTMEFVSDGCEALIGHAAADVIGSSLRSFGRAIHPDDREGVWQGVQEAVRERRAFELTYRIFTATGEEKWVWEQGQGVFDSEGEVEALEGLIVDITRHKRTEEELARRLEQYRSLYGAMPDGIIIVSRDDEVLDANDTACEMLGLSREELIAGGLTPRRWDAIGEDGSPRPPDARPSLTTLETGQPVRGVVTGIRPTPAHDWRWLLINTEPVLDPADGSLRAVVIALTDITARKQAEEALRDSERRYRTLAETAQDLIFIIGPDDTVQYINTHGAAMVGLKAEDVIGRRHSEFVPADVGRRQCENQRRVFETGEPLRVEARVPVAGGDVWLETHLTPLKDDEGRVTAVLGVARNVTERRRTEEALRASERRYRTLAETAQDSIFIIGPDDTVQYVNTHGAAMLGTSPEKIIGRKRASLFPPEVGRRQGENLREVLETGQPLRAEEFTQFMGHDVWLETHLTPLRDDDGHVTAVLGVARDVTERRRIEEAQRLATVGELAAGVAHEFNNLLASMSLGAELALGSGTQRDHRRLAEVVLQATDRGASICKNLTAFARPRPPQRTPIVLESALEAALALASSQLSSAGVRVERHYNARGQGILADARQLEQVFLNIILNACQAMPDGGSLRVVVAHVPAEDGPGEVAASITDTGRGIAPEHLAHIFEPFFTTRRGDHSDENSGAGLGLSVSHSIVTANEGIIEVSSEEGCGASFRVRFPVCLAEAGPDAAPEAEAEPSPEAVGDGVRILVAEDAHFLREMLIEGLGVHGFAVVATRNAEEAVRALGDGRFDLVVTDLTMPGGGGRKVLAAARALPEPPAVIVITGKIEESVASQLLEQGASAFLPKPFRFDALLAAMRACRGELDAPSQDPART